MDEKIIRNPARLRASVQETRHHWADRLLELATSAYRAHEYERATELLIRALALDPGQSERIEAAGKRIAQKSSSAGKSIESQLTLELQTRCRLAAAGIGADDQGIQGVINWNGDVARP
jgi:hypothetical protein